MIRRYLKVSISTTLPLYTYLTWLVLHQYPLNITLNDCSDMFCSKPKKKKKERKVSAYRSFYIIIWMKQTPIHVSSSQPPMDKETVSGLRKNNGDILNCCGSFSGCYSFQTFSGFLVIRSLCLYSSTFKLYNDTFFLQ